MSTEPTTIESVREWLTELVASYIEVPTEEIDPETGIVEYGIDSMHKMEILVDIEDHYGVSIDAKNLRDDPTIQAIAESICAALTGEAEDELVEP
jgi:acyl carrier protein